MQYQLPYLFKDFNKLICVNHTSAKPFNIISTENLPDYHLNGDAICIAFNRYDENGNMINNITNWGLNQFTSHYSDESITKRNKSIEVVAE